MPDAPPRPLSEADVLTVPAVARELRIPRKEAQCWLDGHGCVRVVAGQARVIWGDVLAALRRDNPGAIDAPVEPPKPRQGVQAVRRRRRTDAF